MIKVYGQARFIPEEEAPDYLIEIPELELMTQSESIDDVVPMVEDMLSLMFEGTGIVSFVVEWEDKNSGRFSVGTENVDGFLAFIMKRKRQEAGFTLSEFAKHLGFSSHNSIAAYEQATRSPTVGKLAEIAEGLGYELVISLRKKLG
jgi:hypothetical protein